MKKDELYLTVHDADSEGEARSWSTALSAHSKATGNKMGTVLISDLSPADIEDLTRVGRIQANRSLELRFQDYPPMFTFENARGTVLEAEGFEIAMEVNERDSGDRWVVVYA